ncbi:MAG: MFS transporter [Anaerorhabdus sp.]
MGYKDLYKERNFLKYTIGNAVSRFGDSIDSVAFSILVYQITGSASLMALLLGVNFIPNVIIQPFTGVIVDYLDKKNIQVITNILRALAVLTAVLLYINNSLEVIHLFILTFTISCTECFQAPASKAMLPLLLDDEKYTIGLSLQESLNKSSELLGLMLAPVIIGLIGVKGALLIDFATFIICMIMMVLINYPKEVIEKKTISFKQIFIDFKEGIAYVSQIKIVMCICVFSCAINFFLVAFNSLQTPFVYDILKMGASGLSLLGIATTLGMFVGSALYPKIEDKINHLVLFTVSGILISMLHVGLVMAANESSMIISYIYLGAGAFISGVNLAIVNLMSSVTMAKSIKQEYMGRVYSVLYSISGAAMPVASFIVAAIVLQINITVLIGATGICSALVFVLLSFAKSMKQL